MGGLEVEIQCLGRWFFGWAGVGLPARPADTSPRDPRPFAPVGAVVEPHAADDLPVTRGCSLPSHTQSGPRRGGELCKFQGRNSCGYICYHPCGWNISLAARKLCRVASTSRVGPVDRLKEAASRHG